MYDCLVFGLSTPKEHNIVNEYSHTHSWIDVMARSFYDLSIFSYTIIIPKSLGLIQLQPSIEQLRTSKNKHVRSNFKPRT